MVKGEMHPRGSKVFIVAGEASGDLHGAKLVEAMRAADPRIFFRGIGGRAMLAAGVELLWDAADMAVVGFSEVVAHLGTIWRALVGAKRTLRQWRPDLLVLIDYPEFNLQLARQAKKVGIPVMYYISPQVWAWRSGRVHRIRRLVDKMVVILPFEQDWYRQAGVDAEFVGHPLLDEPEGEPTISAVQEVGDGGKGGAVVGLLPGSRRGEVKALLPVLLQAAEIMAARIPGTRFVLPLASTVTPAEIAPYLQEVQVTVEVVAGGARRVLKSCDLAVVASGTVTLEAAIAGTPVVVVYKVHPLTYWLGKRLVQVKWVSLVNIVAGEEVAPELLQDEATPERVAAAACTILQDAARRSALQAGLAKVRAALGSPGAAQRAAAVALQLLQRQQGPIPS